VFEQALARMAALGAVLLDPLDIPNQAQYRETEFTVLMHEFKVGLADYLARYQPDAPVRNLGELIEWNRVHASRVMPHFGQELFEMAEATAGLQAPAYLEALAQNERYARREGLDALFAQHQLDAVVAPSGSTAWLTDPLLGDHFLPGGITSPFAVAGYPHLTVPMGLADGLPVGLSLGGLAWQDTRLLSLGHAFEQAQGLTPRPRLGRH
jgi:amidase